MSKHTPGPWVADYDETIVNDDERHSVKANGLFIVSLLKSGTFTEDEHSEEAEEEVRANAHLIAAAPDLLKVLKRIADAMDFNGTGHPLFDGMQKQMTDAIAKAEGR